MCTMFSFGKYFTTLLTSFTISITNLHGTRLYFIIILEHWMQSFSSLIPHLALDMYLFASNDTKFTLNGSACNSDLRHLNAPSASIYATKNNLIYFYLLHICSSSSKNFTFLFFLIGIHWL